MTWPAPRESDRAARRQAQIAGQVIETLGAQFPNLPTGRLLTVVVHAAHHLHAAAVTPETAASQDDYVRALTATALDLLAAEAAARPQAAGVTRYGD